MKEIPLPKAALPTEYIALEVPISDDMEIFIELITGNHTHCGDVLVNAFCGYWAYGIQRDRDKSNSWLIYVDPVSCGDPPAPGLDQEYASHCFTRGEPLPEHYYALNREVAKKALKHGLTRWGDSFLNGNCDYSDYDQTVQMALFDEVIYG
jgi:hypothetical protein